MFKNLALNFLKQKKLINFKPVVGFKIFSLTPKVSHFTTTTAAPQEDFNNFMKQYEENMKKANLKSLQLLQAIKSNQTSTMNTLINEILEIPVKLGSNTDLKNYILENLEKIPLNPEKEEEMKNFLLFIEKLEIDNFENHFLKIEPKYRNNLTKYNKETLIAILYTYSKYRVLDQKVWNQFHDLLINQVKDLDLEHSTKLLLALTMATGSQKDLLSNEKSENLYREIFNNIEKKIGQLKYLDTFRIFISMTKKPVPIKTISDSTWAKLQKNFKENINYFDLYQISQILLLICEMPNIDFEVFKVVENELIKEYLEQIEGMVKNAGGELNLQSLLDDISKISFAMALSRQGSVFYWNKLIKTMIKYHSSVSQLCMENMSFVCNRLADYIIDINASSKPEIMVNLETLFLLFVDKIKQEKLLQENKIDPFNLMMPLARFSIIDEEIWNPLTHNIMEMMNNPQFVVNPYIITDITFAFSHYYTDLIMNSFEKGQKYENNYYLKNFEGFWKRVEELLLKVDEKQFELPNISNIIIDLTQIDLELPKAWNKLADLVRLNLQNVDKNYIIYFVMGFSKVEYKDQVFWKELQDFVKLHINEFTVEDLKKITLSFLKNKDTVELWKSIESRLSSPEMIKDITFESFNDLQIPLALLGMNNDKIWNRFEELVFKNIGPVTGDKDLLLNTIYSFSRIGRGSALLWQKLCTTLKEQMEGYEIEDLGHIVVCFKSNVISKNNLTSILDKIFWDSLLVKIDEKLNNANLNTCNNLLKGLKENDLIKSDKITKKVEDRISALLKKV
jgi:hypothetical protein